LKLPARQSKSLARKGLTAFGIVGVLCFVAAGCILSPHKKDKGGTPPPPTYGANLAPESVLVNLARAYQNRDTLEYASLYDDSYTGSSLDNLDPNAQVIPFTKADEARHIASLAQSTSITSITLTLRPTVTTGAHYHDNGDPPGWSTIQDPFLRLTIDANPTSYDVPLTDDKIFFKFIPTPVASSSDTTWKIIQWTEVFH